MPLKRKHLSSLRLANLPFREEFIVGEHSTFIIINESTVVDTINFLQDNFKEDLPFIPLNFGGNEYWLYINKNDDKN